MSFNKVTNDYNKVKWTPHGTPKSKIPPGRSKQETNSILDEILKHYEGEALMKKLHTMFKMPPLLWFSSIGHVEGVKKIMPSVKDFSVKHSQDGNTSLHLAAKGGHVEMSRLLISFGANLGAENQDGNTPFMVAVAAGSTGVVNLLWQHRTLFNVSHTNKCRQTALHFAALRSWESCVALLVSGGIAKNYSSKPNGRTALMLTAERGDKGSTEMLVEAGAALLLEDKCDSTALCLAMQHQYDALAAYLLGRLDDQQLNDYIKRRVELMTVLPDSALFFPCHFLEQTLYIVLKYLARIDRCRGFLIKHDFFVPWVKAMERNVDEYDTNCERAYVVMMEVMYLRPSMVADATVVHCFTKAGGPALMLSTLENYKSNTHKPALMTAILPLVPMSEIAEGRKWLGKHYSHLSEVLPRFEKYKNTVTYSSDLRAEIDQKWNKFMGVYRKIQAVQAEIHGAELVATEEREKAKREKKREKRKLRRQMQKAKEAQLSSQLPISDSFEKLSDVGLSDTESEAKLSDAETIGSPESAQGDTPAPHICTHTRRAPQIETQSDWPLLKTTNASTNSAKKRGKSTKATTTPESKDSCAQIGESVFVKVLPKKKVREMKRKQKANREHNIETQLEMQPGLCRDCVTDTDAASVSSYGEGASDSTLTPHGSRPGTPVSWDSEDDQKLSSALKDNLYVTPTTVEENENYSAVNEKRSLHCQPLVEVPGEVPDEKEPRKKTKQKSVFTFMTRPESQGVAPSYYRIRDIFGSSYRVSEIYQPALESKVMSSPTTHLQRQLEEFVIHDIRTRGYNDDIQVTFPPKECSVQVVKIYIQSGHTWADKLKASVKKSSPTKNKGKKICQSEEKAGVEVLHSGNVESSPLLHEETSSISLVPDQETAEQHSEEKVVGLKTPKKNKKNRGNKGTTTYTTVPLQEFLWTTPPNSGTTDLTHNPASSCTTIQIETQMQSPQQAHIQVSPEPFLPKNEIDHNGVTIDYDNAARCLTALSPENRHTNSASTQHILGAPLKITENHDAESSHVPEWKPCGHLPPPPPGFGAYPAMSGAVNVGMLLHAEQQSPCELIDDLVSDISTCWSDESYEESIQTGEDIWDDPSGEYMDFQATELYPKIAGEDVTDINPCKISNQNDMFDEAVNHNTRQHRLGPQYSGETGPNRGKSEPSLLFTISEESSLDTGDHAFLARSNSACGLFSGHTSPQNIAHAPAASSCETRYAPDTYRRPRRYYSPWLPTPDPQVVQLYSPSTFRTFPKDKFSPIKPLLQLDHLQAPYEGEESEEFAHLTPDPDPLLDNADEEDAYVGGFIRREWIGDGYSLFGPSDPISDLMMKQMDTARVTMDGNPSESQTTHRKRQTRKVKVCGGPAKRGAGDGCEMPDKAQSTPVADENSVDPEFWLPPGLLVDAEEEEMENDSKLLPWPMKSQSSPKQPTNCCTYAGHNDDSKLIKHSPFASVVGTSDIRADPGDLNYGQAHDASAETRNDKKACPTSTIVNNDPAITSSPMTKVSGKRVLPAKVRCSGASSSLTNVEMWLPLVRSLLTKPVTTLEKIGRLILPTYKAEFILPKSTSSRPCGSHTVVGLVDGTVGVGVKCFTMGTFYDPLPGSENSLVSQLTMDDLKHPNIAPYMVLENRPYCVYVATQLCRSDLSRYVRQGWVRAAGLGGAAGGGGVVSGGGGGGGDVGVIHGMLDGLDYLHRRGLYHGNLKPANVLVDTEGRARLTDYGVTSYSCRGASPQGACCWAPSEAFWNDTIPNGFKADIQVAGMLVYYILTGGLHPFGDTPEQIQANIATGKYHMKPISDEADDLLRHLLAFAPNGRMEVSKTLRHPFFWSAKRRYNFVIAVAKLVSRENSTTDLLRLKLQAITKKTSGSAWQQSTPVALLREVARVSGRRGSYSDDLSDHLVFVGNCMRMWDQLSEVVRRPLAEPTTWLLSTFPDLLMAVYRVIIQTQSFSHLVEVLDGK